MRFAPQHKSKEASMPTAQTTKAANEKNKTNKRPVKSKDVESDTGERDENYNLISALYHALQGAETAAQYKQDAEANGEEELVQFFEEARSSHTELASQAKRLLAARLDATDEDEDEDEEEDDED
jgi:hypothetical protein